ncbi:thiol-disulfide oxidoreductase DCC family protein [uncultured Polaribacter sp.]|uniref:thiol-disulfide oxidoreductase DCC family protein n=1 Tax=uncultured Polaribacter sp. TaxID=174711 RepID=UPI002618D6B3|nr:DCC1-like thiol-disulfide oxidoreductase family protein [uncultured Polaribacter sp.]
MNFIKDLNKPKKIILFDGICNLCNNSVLKVINNDKQNTFMFASLQSKVGQEIVNFLKIDITKVDSIILYEPGISYDIKSTAAIKIMNDFSGIWKLSYLFWVFPESFRNFFYDYISKNRYKWFGKKESCMIPTSKLKSKFLN